MNLWMKRAIGTAALGGSLLALGAGAASAQEVSADASASLGRPTTAQVRVCADGRILSSLLGSCSSQSGTSATVRAGDGIRARIRVPKVASADVSVGTRRSPAAGASASAATRPSAATADADASADTSPRARADADASLTRPRVRRLLALRPLASLAGVGLLGSSSFTLAGDPATASLLPVGELTLDDPASEAPAGIGVIDSGPIASGNQVDVQAGDVSPAVPVTVCGNGVGVLGDASASCGANQPVAADDGSTGATSTAGTPALTQSAGTLAGNQVEASAGDISPSVPVTVCGNAVGDASASCGANQQTSSGGTTQPSSDGSSSSSSDTSGNQAQANVESVSASVPVTVCGNEVGLLGDSSASCGADTSSSGVVAPTPGTNPGSTDTDGIPGSTGTSGIPGTSGLTPGTSGSAGDPTLSFAPLRPSVAAVDTLAFTGSASDLLAAVAAALLVAGVLIVRAARPATAATERR